MDDVEVGRRVTNLVAVLSRMNGKVGGEWGREVLVRDRNQVTPADWLPQPSVPAASAAPAAPQRPRRGWRHRPPPSLTQHVARSGQGRRRGGPARVLMDLGGP